MEGVAGWVNPKKSKDKFTKTTSFSLKGVWKQFPITILPDSQLCHLILHLKINQFHNVSSLKVTYGLM